MNTPSTVALSWAYAIGAPSVEMFIDSYNETHKKSDGTSVDYLLRIETRTTEGRWLINTATGYTYSTNGGSSYDAYTSSGTILPDYGGMYCGTPDTTGEGSTSYSESWLCSPSAAVGGWEQEWYACRVYGSGQLGKGSMEGNGTWSKSGVTPLVSLKKDFKLKLETE